MPVVGQVVEIDKGFDKIKDTFLRDADLVLKVGIQGSEAKEQHTGTFTNPLTNLEVGVIHEFGAPGAGIPERSFIRAPAKANAQRYFQIIKTIVKASIAGITTPREGLKLLGIKVEADFKNNILKGISPSLKRNRRRKKTQPKKRGKQIPLFDEGQLFRSITWRVGKK